jgi:MFS family permease
MADRFASENATYPSWAELFSGGRGKRIASILTIIVLHGGGNYAVVTLTPSIVADIGGIELIGALTALFNVATLLAAAAIGPLVPRFGTARLWWFMTAIATLGAALSTLADSMVAVAVGRGLAGFGGGGLLAIGCPSPLKLGH